MIDWMMLIVGIVLIGVALTIEIHEISQRRRKR